MDLPAQPTYDDFAAKILEDLNLSGLGEKERDDLLAAIRERVEQRVLLVIMDNLNEEDVAELNKKLGEGMKQEEILPYMSSKIPNLQDLISKELAGLYDEIVEQSKTIVAGFQR